MKINVDGQVYDYDERRLLNSELAFIQKKTGLKFEQWQQGLTELDAFATRALVYVLKKRAGEEPDWDALDFNMLEIFDTDEDEDVEAVEAPKEAAPLSVA